MGKKPVCLTVSLLDGLLLARSGLHHSANFRSAMIFGQPTLITNPDKKRAKLSGFIDTLNRGRSSILRPMTESEVKQTAVRDFRLRSALSLVA